ncbi:pirin family protein [Saccharospirillum salsuginis]|uniref:Pirin family protein n=1 Tax=Saccharospirillum salsuginis TaxID=418750 RepID=A0A918KBG5_9GAMM|nr:pirin-like bicupin family protein [Saccharospirillum salsuginis]GGX55390.1 hypothetical protein GCM10007392_23830 [Saccharospirillum salsuginis]
MIYKRPAADRGRASFGWLLSRHSFSFGHYYDPEHMGLSVLRVINDDRVNPGAGFETHGHRDMEILSYVLDGTIEHRDSLGHTQRIEAGEFQIMSAGTGVLHSEYNASATEPLHFLQIWLLPNEKGVEPRYDQKAFEKRPGGTPILHPTEDGALRAHTDGRLWRYRGGEDWIFKPEGKKVYVHGVDGLITANGEIIGPGDGAAFDDATVEFKGDHHAEVLVFDLP